MAEPSHLLNEDYPADRPPPDVPLGSAYTALAYDAVGTVPETVATHYKLTWVIPSREGAITYQLDPSWEGHDAMIKHMSLLERRILKVWLETVIESIDRAAWPSTDG